MIDYAAAMEYAYPDALWTLDGNTYEGLRMLEGDKPTQKALEQAWADYEKAAADKAAADKAARDAAIAHAKSLGFTDEMIAVMYPGLTV